MPQRLSTVFPSALADSDIIERGFPFTVAGPRRIYTGFPFTPNGHLRSKHWHYYTKARYSVKRLLMPEHHRNEHDVRDTRRVTLLISHFPAEALSRSVNRGHASVKGTVPL